MKDVSRGFTWLPALAVPDRELGVKLCSLWVISYGLDNRRDLLITNPLFGGKKWDALAAGCLSLNMGNPALVFMQIIV